MAPIMTPSVLDKVKKLLRLSTSSNAHEAACAAAKAQELIDRHQLTQAVLEDEHGAGSVPHDEPIHKFDDAPLDQPKRLDYWRQRLASVLARANACRIYMRRPHIFLVGRPSDAETVRYLYAWLSADVMRLAEVNGAGKGVTWRNNFRIGVVDGIAEQLRAQRAAFIRTSRAEAQDNPQALMRVDQALARLDQRANDVEVWVRTHMNLRAGSASYSNYDSQAREAGRRAGRDLTLGGTRRGLASGRRQLPA